MKQRIWKKSFWRRGIILLLAVLFIPILEMSAESRAYSPAESPTISPKEDASPTLVVRREEEDLWSLWITPRLYGLTEGEPAALLLRIHAPDGRFVREITEGYGTRGMTLTHGELPAGEVGVLLDGRLSEAADGAILWVRMEESRDLLLKQGDHMGVTGGDGDPTTLFVLQRDGHVSEIPLTVKVDQSGWREDSCQDSCQDSSCPDSSEDNCLDSNEETTGSVTEQPPASDTNPPETEKIQDAIPSVFLGCRETGVTGGVYTVQFLFKGDGEHTPLGLRHGTPLASRDVPGERGRLSSCIWNLGFFPNDGSKQRCFETSGIALFPAKGSKCSSVLRQKAKESESKGQKDKEEQEKRG